MARKSRSKKSKKTTSKSTWLVVPAMPWDNPADFTGPNAKQIKLSIHPKIGAYRKYIGGRNSQLGKDPAKAGQVSVHTAENQVGAIRQFVDKTS